jgi:primosomal protein N'
LSSQTQNQKDIHRWQIKRGQVSVILCTYAEIFQDFADLQKIIRVDPHKWYYANQQDPRYKVGDVLAQMAQLRGAEMESA